MSWTSFAELDGVTVGATELSVISGTTTLATDTNKGIYWLFVDASNMAKADEYAIRVYDKVEATGGTKRQIFKAILSDAQSEPFVTPPLPLGNGWDMTIQKIAGTDRAFDAEIRKV
jgi:hypothetical protein